MATPMPLRAFEAHLVNYRRVWRGSLTFTFVNPLLFLAAMGLGLGTIVAPIDGIPYKSFIAPGLLAASAMQLGVSEALWPVMSAIKWQRTYFAQVASPLRPADAALGHLVFIGFRVFMSTIVFLVVMVAFGTVESPWAVLAPLVATLCGVTHAALTMCFSASREDDAGGFASFNRFVVTPLFLFGGTFFPVTQLPPLLRLVAYVTPLWNGVALCRSLTVGTVTAGAAVVHLAVMGLWLTAGITLFLSIYQRRLAA
jgi:lipooligosaccharide transport system permease protein